MCYELVKEMVDEICPGTEKMKKWEGSVFESLILKYIPAERGKAAEKIFSRILTDNGIEHKLMTDNKIGYDFILSDGKKLELKYASEQAKGGFCFDQVRVEDNRYHGIIFMFVSPEGAKFYYVPKDKIRNFRTSSQHSGQSNACTLSSTKKNMELFESFGDGSVESIIEQIK